MEKKSVSATLLILYLSALFAVVGSCFYAFVFKEKQIKIEEVRIVADSSMLVYEDENKTKIAKNLRLSDMEIGIRPATGKVDKDFKVPSTINDEGTSEGYYATVYVDSSINYKIVLKNIMIESKEDELEVKEERKNIFISIKDILDTTKTLEDEETEIVVFSDVKDTQKLTFFIWLGADAGKSLQGAKISFDLEFLAI